MSMPSPPAVGSPAFAGILVPPDAQAKIINLLIEEAAFASSITRLPTSSGSVAFPIAAPAGAAWIAELARIPLMSLNDRAEVVAVAKLAGLLDVSNEMISDARSISRPSSPRCCGTRCPGSSMRACCSAAGRPSRKASSRPRPRWAAPTSSKRC